MARRRDQSVSFDTVGVLNDIIPNQWGLAAKPGFAC